LLEPEAADNLRAEYAATSDAYMHYDNFAWQVGGVLLAGVFIYWGFIVSTPNLKTRTLLIGNVLVCVLMSLWLLYVAHNRQISLFKIHRLHELETALGLCQHKRFRKCGGREPIYRKSWPSGNLLDSAVYIVVSFGGLMPTLVPQQFQGLTRGDNILLLLTVVLVIGTIWRVHTVDRATKALIKNLEQASSANCA
jgi:hypothetical protein